jgi:hypothetical protein
VGGLLLMAMGVLAGAIAFTGPEMPDDGWQTQLSTWLRHATSVTVRALSGLPGRVVGVALVVLSVVLMVRQALRAYRGRVEPWRDEPDNPAPMPVSTRVDEDV